MGFWNIPDILSRIYLVENFCALCEFVSILMGAMASNIDEPMDVEVRCCVIIYIVPLKSCIVPLEV